MAQNNLGNKKIAIVHDWLVGGGAEKVVQALHELFPDAPIYTSCSTDEWRKKLDNKVITGYLQNWPFSKLRKYLPVFRIWWFEHLNLKDYDIVISSSGNGEAKGVKKLKSGAIHICYCHSPTHFYWDKYDEYLKSPGFGFFNPLARASLKILVGPLRKWDLKASNRPNYFIANSCHIQKMIKKYYRRESVVIHPPVDISRFKNLPLDKPRNGFVTIGRQTPYKRTDIIVQACTKLNLPLAVLGGGPEHKHLQKIASASILFFEGYASDHDVEQALIKASAFIFASNEDFGILPVEAMAAGTPVIAFKAGGALDYVNPKTGIFFEEQTTESLEKALIN
ncbi:MAG TPA: glycosyltransferase, partial [Patescibacteria group bacterium]|nr:glycosyltransferase [Patescibacteria group bacterium]